MFEDTMLQPIVRRKIGLQRKDHQGLAGWLAMILKALMTSVTESKFYVYLQWVNALGILPVIVKLTS